MKIYVLIPCYFDGRELELLRLERLFKSLDKAINNTDLEIDVRICGLYGSNQNRDILTKNHNYLKIVSKGNNYPDQRRHLLMRSVMEEELDINDKFVFLDADDIVSDKFFEGVEKLKEEELGFVSRFSILSSDDGTLGIQLPPSEVKDYSIFPKNTGDEFKHLILSGEFGGQVWGVFFPIGIMKDEVYDKLPYISMWEDVRFWMSFGCYKVHLLEGRYYWVRNNKESLSSNLVRTDPKFAMNVQEIIWELQRQGWSNEDIFNFNLIRYARFKLDGEDSLNLYDYDEEENITEPTDRRIISIVDKKVDMLPTTKFWNEFPKDWSGYDYCYKEILDDFLYRIV